MNMNEIRLNMDIKKFENVSFFS